jgi:hypothetical protein
VATDGGSGVSTCGERSSASIAAVDVQHLAGERVRQVAFCSSVVTATLGDVG